MDYSMTSIPHPQPINTPDQLKELLVELKQCLLKNQLIQVKTKNRTDANLPLEQIPSSGPWPDFMEIDFQNPHTQEKYRLIAETYHGTGGQWEKI